MREYHLAWLSVHPDRSEEWLREKLLDGFDVHHLDGDHSNNSPENLILVEACDHMRLHGMKLADGITSWRKNLGHRTAARNRARAEAFPASRGYEVPFDEPSIKAYLTRIGKA